MFRYADFTPTRSGVGYQLIVIVVPTRRSLVQLVKSASSTRTSILPVLSDRTQAIVFGGLKAHEMILLVAIVVKPRWRKYIAGRQTLLSNLRPPGEERGLFVSSRGVIEVRDRVPLQASGAILLLFEI